MKYYLQSILFLFLIHSVSSYAQDLDAMIRDVEKNLVFPVVKSHIYMGVLPVVNPGLKFEKESQHHIAIDLELGFSDSSRVNFGITEIGRTLNLHVANGARKELIEMAVIIHGPALSSFFSDTLYKSRYGISNPNASVIHELSQNGIRFYVCGQNLSLFKIAPEKLLSEVEVVLSAKTTITALQDEGYSFLYIWPGY